MLPIVFEGAIEFLESRHFGDKMPHIMTFDNYDEIINLLWEAKDFVKKVFGIVGVQKYNINCFFFQLIASKILSFEWVGTTAVNCVITRDKNDKYLFKDRARWEGFTFRTGGRQRSVSFLDILRSTD